MFRFTFSTLCHMSSDGKVFKEYFRATPNAMIKLSITIIPIYAVLWAHREDNDTHPDDNQVRDPWSVVTKAQYASHISIKVCGEAVFNLRMAKNRPYEILLNGKTLNTPTSTLTRIARFLRWIGIRRSIPILEGKD